MTATDASWAGVARSTREALRLLGHDIGPDCLPGEPDACSGSFTQHAVAHFATIAAIVDHQMGHLGPAFNGMFAEIRGRKLAELQESHHDQPH